jgi:glycosyltransferase involved in cell wall biosynthesis
MRAVFICQSVDRDDPIQGGTIQWIEALARNPAVTHVRVLALRTGTYESAAEVEVTPFGRTTKLRTLVAFYWATLSALRARPHFFLIYQGGPYPLLLLPFKLILRIPIVQWKAHRLISRAMRFYARWCDDLILTSSPAGFPMDSRKVRVVGQGINTQLFEPRVRSRLGDLVATCRLTPIKHIGEMIEAVAHANKVYGTHYRLDVYGPALSSRDRSYARHLEELIDGIGARQWINIKGPVSQDKVPEVLSGYRAYLNYCGGAINRSVVEAMACELPVISTNDAVAELIPAELHSALIVSREDKEEQAAVLHELLEKPSREIDELGRRMRTIVVSEHGIDGLIERILTEIRTLA